MNDSNSPETILLLNAYEHKVIPLSSSGLEIASGSQSSIEQHFIGTLVLYRDGQVFRIGGVKFLNLAGANDMARAVSFANGGTHRVSVDLRPEERLGLNEVRRLTIEYLRRNPSVLTDFFDQSLPLESVVEDIAKASTLSELFDALRVGPPEQQLDELAAPGRRLTLLELMVLLAVLTIAMWIVGNERSG